MKKFTTILILAVVTATALFAFKPATVGEPVTVIVTHEVKDFDTWKKAFDADNALRLKMGMTTEAVFASVQKPNEVTIIFSNPSLESVNGLIGNPALKEKMQKAGVISEPQFKILYKK